MAAIIAPDIQGLLAIVRFVFLGFSSLHVSLRVSLNIQLKEE